MNMNIELIKPETQAKLRKPVLIIVGVALVLGIIWLVTHIVRTSGLSSTEYIDSTSGTVVDTYGGAVVESSNLIYGIESIEDDLPPLVYGKLETVARQFVTLAFPNEQFSYKKSSLRQDAEGYYVFEIESSERRLTVRFVNTEDELTQLEIISGKSVIYNYDR